MTVFEAILLGAVQGITEFLPISSDGHLVLASALLGRDPAEGGLATTVLLHLGSLVAIGIVFFKDLLALVYPRIDFRAWAVLFVASLPAAVVGFTLKKFLPESLEHEIERAVLMSPLWAACGLLFTGLVLWTAEMPRTLWVRLADVRAGLWWGVLAIGFAQALAILPGVSRSGCTISTALAFKWLRPEAVRLSFMMGFIAVAGAGLIEAREIQAIEPAPAIAGFLSSLVFSLFGLWGIRLVVARSKLRWFSVYCLLAGLAGLLWLALR